MSGTVAAPYIYALLLYCARCVNLFYIYLYNKAYIYIYIHTYTVVATNRKS